MLSNIKNEDIFFVVNVKSGKGEGVNIIKELCELGFENQFVATKSKWDFSEFINKNTAVFKVIVLVGGDGTINESLKYFYNKNDVLIGILPIGSGNGFARELGFKKSLPSLLKAINNGESINVDILSVNSDKFINVAGIGFDGLVAHHFQHKKGRGLRNYIICTIKSILEFKPFYAEIDIDNTIITGTFQMITIANTRQFGNNAIISPQSNPSDGIFEVVLIKQMPFYYLPKFVTNLFLGTLKKSKYIEFVQVKREVEINSQYSKCHIDGEPKIYENKMVIKKLKNNIKFVKTV